jgi:hypothetical protein
MQANLHHMRASPVGPVRVYVLNSSDVEVAYAAGFALVPCAPKHVSSTFVFHIARLVIGFCEQGHLRFP